MMVVRAVGDRLPPQSRVFSVSTRFGIPALLAQAGVMYWPISNTIAPPPLLKLLRPLVLLVLPRIPPSMKFIWNIVVVSEVSWNSGVVSPAVDSAPGNL